MVFVRRPMKLKAWFVALGTPVLALMAILLLSTLLSGRGFVRRLHKLRGDAAVASALQRLVVAIDREAQLAGTAIADIRSVPQAFRADYRTEAFEGAVLASARGMAALDRAVASDRALDHEHDDAIALWQTDVRRMRRSEHDAIVDAVRMARAGRFAESEERFRDAARIGQDSLRVLLTGRLRAEQNEMDEVITVLSAEKDGVILFALGGGIQKRLSRIPLALQRQAHASAATRRLQEYLTHLSGTDVVGAGDAELDATRASSALESLARTYSADSIPADVRFARSALARARALDDSIAGLARANGHRSTILHAGLSWFTPETLAHLDSLPAAYERELDEVAAAATTRGLAVNLVLTVLVLLTAVFAIGIPYLLARSVIAPLVELQAASVRVAAGAFDVRLADRGIGEVRALRRSFGKMTERLGQFAASQRETETILRASEGRYRVQSEQLAHLLASGPAAVVHLRVAGAEPELLYMSENVRDQIGYTASDFLTNQGLWASLVHPEDMPGIGESLALTLSGQTGGFEFRMRHADGAWRWMRGETRLAAPVIDGSPAEVTGWWMDVTAARNTAEAQRAARDAAESANRAKSDFLANMSHEIRTPMNGVMGMLELALDSEMRPEQRDYLEVARNSADSLLTVINDILDFSKIEAGKMDLDASPFRVAEALEDMLSGLALRAHDKGLELAFRLDPDVPDGIVGDVGRLRQVLINLVGNAIKFTERGEVLVSVGVESTDHDRTVLRFSVVDTGIGIDEAKHAAIFDAFTQADSTTTRHFGGTGLGLAIASRLVALMGGRIWVESVVGQGSAFRFTADFTPCVLAVAAAENAPADLCDVPVLVVDDNGTNRAILEGMLIRWGMRPTVVDGGPAALALLANEHSGRAKFRLLIVDARMPEMDGFGLVERVRGDKSWGEPAIMMLSSATFHDDVRRCREAGIDLYLTKPVRGAELRAAISQLLAQSACGQRATTIQPKATMPSDSQHPVRVLLAEDNSVNRRLALALLERRGATVTVAVNGREAVEAWDHGKFDVVLMDIQMPEMDGIEATRLIRSREAEDGRVPVIAVSARAMPGDRERFLEAGMDAYIAKPLRAGELMETIDRLVRAAGPAASASREAGDGAPPVIDLDAFRATVGGDDLLMGELVALFQRDSSPYVARLTAADGAGDRVELREAAHALKGAAYAIGAARTGAVAHRIERAAPTGDLAEMTSMVHEAEEAVRELQVELAIIASEREVPALA